MGERVEAERWALYSAGSRDDSPRPVLPPGIADIEFTVTMETGPEAMTFVRFIPYSRGYVINAVPSSFALSCFSTSVSSSSCSFSMRCPLFLFVQRYEGSIVRWIYKSGYYHCLCPSLVIREGFLLDRWEAGWFVK